MKKYMKKLSFLFALIGCTAVAQINDSKFTSIESKVVQWRHEIHQNPELSNREFNTAKKVARTCRSF